MDKKNLKYFNNENNKKPLKIYSHIDIYELYKYLIKINKNDNNNLNQLEI